MIRICSRGGHSHLIARHVGLAQAAYRPAVGPYSGRRTSVSAYEFHAARPRHDALTFQQGWAVQSV